MGAEVRAAALDAETQVHISKSLDYSVGEDLRQLEKIVRSEANVRFREDLLEYLGPTRCVYLAPPGPGDRKSKQKMDYRSGPWTRGNTLVKYLVHQYL